MEWGYLILGLSALLLFYIGYRDQKTGKIVRWHALLFMLVALAGRLLVSGVWITMHLAGTALIAGLLWLWFKGFKIASPSDVFVFTGATLLAGNALFVLAVAIGTTLVLTTIWFVKGKKPVVIPWTGLVAVLTVLWWGVALAR